MAEQFANGASTVLTSGVDAVVTSLPVASTVKFPGTGNYRLIIEDEIMIATAKSASDFTVQRGQEGTTATTHPVGATVSLCLTAGALAQLKVDALVPGALVMAVIAVGCTEIMGGTTSYLRQDFAFSPSGTEVMSFLCTKAGYIRDLFVHADAGPGGGTETATFTMRKNGADPLTRPQVVLTDTANSGSDIADAHAMAVAAGDRISLEVVTSVSALALENVIASFNFSIA